MTILHNNTFSNQIVKLSGHLTFCEPELDDPGGASD